MKNFSNQYMRLLESMKSSDDDLLEDKDTRMARREERKKERLEKKFGGDSKKGDDDSFNLKAFQKAVEALKEQSLAYENECKTRAKSKSPGKKTAEEYLPKFVVISDRIADFLGEIRFRIGKEGKRLEAEDQDNRDLMDSYRKIYNDLVSDLDETAKNYNSKEQKANVSYYEDKKFGDIAGKVAEAEEKFKKGKNELAAKNGDIQLEITKDLALLSATGDSGATGGNSSQGGKSLAEEIKGSLPIKATEAAKKGDEIKKVKELIYKKFKNHEKVSKDSDFKIVTKNIGPSFKGNTQSLIKKLKAGFDIKDQTAEITAEFIKELETVKESKNTLLSFNDFLNKTNEAFDPDKFEKAGGSSGSSGSGDKKVSYSSENSEPTPFTTDEEGNAFRKWVNDNHAEWAKKNQLDPSGKKDNPYIRKAYKEFKEEYIKKGADNKEAKKLEEIEKGPIEVKNVYSKIKELYNLPAFKTIQNEVTLGTDTVDPNQFIIVMKSKFTKQTFVVFESGRVKYYVSDNKYYIGTIKGKGSSMDKWKVKFDTLKLEYSFMELCSLASGKALMGQLGSSEAQGKKAYLSGAYTNVRTSPSANTGLVNNLLYKHEDKNTPIGMVLMKQLTKGSGEVKDWNWYKIQFPTKMRGYETGWVREDTVDLK